jgi:hypothetical protein
VSKLAKIIRETKHKKKIISKKVDMKNKTLERYKGSNNEWITKVIKEEEIIKCKQGNDIVFNTFSSISCFILCFSQY